MRNQVTSNKLHGTSDQDAARIARSVLVFIVHTPATQQSDLLTCLCTYCAPDPGDGTYQFPRSCPDGRSCAVCTVHSDGSAVTGTCRTATATAVHGGCGPEREGRRITMDDGERCACDIECRLAHWRTRTACVSLADCVPGGGVCAAEIMGAGGRRQVGYSTFVIWNSRSGSGGTCTSGRTRRPTEAGEDGDGGWGWV